VRLCPYPIAGAYVKPQGDSLLDLRQRLFDLALEPCFL
jgi:hypothetical protein